MKTELSQTETLSGAPVRESAGVWRTGSSEVALNAAMGRPQKAVCAAECGGQQDGP